jgi:cytochrome c biogenesis protein CcmG/thiol:disulfide interchange protein DsbE
MTTVEQPIITSARRTWWIVPALLTVFAMIALFTYALINRDRAQLMSGKAPDFTIQSFDGESITLSDFKGTPVIINFWASWCIECDKEMALLEESAQRYQGEVVFLGIDYLDTEPKARAYLERFGITYPNGPDLGGRISNDFHTKGVPETFFIGKNGTIRALKVGPLSSAELDQWIGQLRAE